MIIIQALLIAIAAKLAKATPELAITLAIPIGLLGVLLWNLQMTLNVFWVHRLDANAEKGELNKIFFNAWLFPCSL